MQRVLTRLSAFTFLLLVATAACDELTDLPGDGDTVPAELAIVEGDSAAATVGSDVEIAVQVLDGSGDPVPGVPVSWAVDSGDGSLSESTVTSDSTGVASTTWTLGTEAGSQAVTASVEGGITTTFTATALAGEVASVAVSEDSVGFEAFGDTTVLSATATDEFGNEHTELAFTWTSADTGIVAVSGAGEVVSAGNGETVVVASVNGVADTAVAAVAQALAALEVEADADTSAIRRPLAVTISRLDPNGHAITDSARLAEIGDPDLSLSDTTKAAVAEDGASVVGAGLGTVTVSATLGEASASADVFFTPAPEDAVASGPFNGCALDVNGEAWCWGSGTSGELGNGETNHYNSPVQVSGGHAFIELAANVTGYCGLTEVGEIYCWGWNGVGGVGVGALNEEAYTTPQPVASSETFATVDGDWYHFCAVTTAGAVNCWGYNWGGALGQDPAGPETCPGFGGSACASSPVLAADQETFTDVAAGYYHTCAIDEAGDAWCWGVNDNGQFGNGGTDTNPVVSPVAGPAGMGFKALDANWSHTCGIDEDDALHCWGYNGAGRLGDGTTENRLTPAAVTLDGSTGAWSDVSASNGYTCATTTGDEAYCWGVNSFGKLGTDDWLSYSSPAPVAGGHAMTAISAGFNTACALDSDGQTHCWGGNDFGALGVGEWPTEHLPVPVAGGHSFTTVSAQSDPSCAVDAAGDAWCWGLGLSGQLGNGANEPEAEPVAVSGGLTFSSVSTAFGHVCGLTTDGDAYCWGSDAGARLGDGDPAQSDRNTPGAVAGGHTFTTISVGTNHSCAVDDTGDAYCWGTGFEGALGDGNDGTNESATPVLVTGGHAFADVQSGRLHTCGLTTGGEIYCWGADNYGQLGTDAVADGGASSTPVLVDGGHDWASLSVAGEGYATCGVTTADEAFCWGVNNRGQLGNGTTDNMGTPTLVSGGNAWTSVVAGGDHACGITTGGTAYCWGDNLGGEIGDGSASGDPVTTPTQVSGGHTFTELSASWAHTCGVTTDDTTYCWGYEGYGNLGHGEMGIRNTPQLVQAGFLTPGAYGDLTGGFTASGDLLFGGSLRASGTLIPPTPETVRASEDVLEMKRR